MNLMVKRINKARNENELFNFADENSMDEDGTSSPIIWAPGTLIQSENVFKLI
jgi:hypothetical protein